MRASMTWLAMYTAQSNIFMLKKVRLELVNSVLSNYYGHACTHSITKKKVVKASSKHIGSWSSQSHYKHTRSLTNTES